MPPSLRYSALLEVRSEPDHDDHAHHRDHATITAPVFTGEALALAGEATFPQHALYGLVLEQEATGFASTVQSSEVFVNSNAPFSALVCGVQGSGKSHSTSVLLESCLIKDDRVGTLPAPLSGLLFHFDTAAGGGVVQPCEAAYLASLDPRRGEHAVPPRVTVLCLPNSLRCMREVYKGLPGVEVQPLHFAARDISAERLLCMMKVDGESHMPLYMEYVMAYIRSMDVFSYSSFRRALQEQKFSTDQKSMLNLRLSLLDACLEGGTDTNRVSTHFGPGKLVIVDLSSPFMDAGSACGFFDMILGLFIEADVRASGKIVVLDEAHKYLTENTSSSRLTESLLSVIRQQRHLATRVVISTQEPTVVPSKFLDLCSFIVAHRFSSPTWLRHLLEHVAARTTDSSAWFSKIASLKTGEALLFAPSGLSVREMQNGSIDGPDKAIGPLKQIAPLGPGYLHVRSRLRITRDGGHSMLAVRDSVLNTRIGPIASQAEPSSMAGLPNDGDPSSGSFPSPSASRNLKSQAIRTFASSAASASTTKAPADMWNSSALIVSIPPDYLPLVQWLKGRPGRRASMTAINLALQGMKPIPFKGRLTRYIEKGVSHGLLYRENSGNKEWVRLLSHGAQ